jgi:hypothetical protein
MFSLFFGRMSHFIVVNIYTDSYMGRGMPGLLNGLESGA